ncbi:MAG: rhodanese-like domain-containing protein [Alphaproteobacteria bacterium]|nr:rhodanese-like domain-containing protein [Alphaproteobacteria bacterium]
MSTQVIRLEDAKSLIEHAPRDVHAQLRAGRAMLVDVREAGEYETARVPGSFLMPLSCFDATHFPALPGVRVILMCAVGKRSAAAAKQLMNAGAREVHHMQGGFNAWKAEGLDFI